MAIALSKVTSQGQISVPSKVRKKLGVGPGSVLEWDEQDGSIVVRRAGRYSSEDLHRALFARAPRPHTVEEMKEGIRKQMKKKHARR